MKQLNVSTPTFPNTFTDVSDRDYDLASPHKWHAKQGDNTVYVAKAVSQKEGGGSVKLHRFILKPGVNEFVDHKDGNGLNNTRSNIRICTRQQNNRNRATCHNSKSGFKGVTWDNNGKIWRARISQSGKQRFLGHYFCVVKAARAYDVAAQEAFGEFAKLNFPMLSKEQNNE